MLLPEELTLCANSRRISIITMIDHNSLYIIHYITFSTSTCVRSTLWCRIIYVGRHSPVAKFLKQAHSHAWWPCPGLHTHRHRRVQRRVTIVVVRCWFPRKLPARVEPKSTKTNSERLYIIRSIEHHFCRWKHSDARTHTFFGAFSSVGDRINVQSDRWWSVMAKIMG